MWTYEKFQNSSDIYSYDIKIFHLIHECTKIPEFSWNLSLCFIRILQLMCEHMKNSKIPVIFILTISKYSTSYMNVQKFLNSGEIHSDVLSKYCSIMHERMKNSKIPPVIFILTISKYSTSYMNMYQNSWVLVKFILTFYQNIAANAWTYEKFQNSSDIYSYDIKIFHLIHEYVPKFLSSGEIYPHVLSKYCSIMCERMKNSKIPVKFIHALSKYSSS